MVSHLACMSAITYSLDLFQKLDEVTASLEKNGIAVGFWHIRRAYNLKADRLAKLATAV